jgi:hypothetical protein
MYIDTPQTYLEENKVVGMAIFIPSDASSVKNLTIRSCGGRVNYSEVGRRDSAHILPLPVITKKKYCGKLI